MKENPKDQPCFHISIVSEMIGLHPQTIRNYERMGLISPSRTEGNMRLFSLDDIERVKKIQSYTNIGVNLAGVEIIIKLLDQTQVMQEKMNKKHLEMKDEIYRLKKLIKNFNLKDKEIQD